MPKHFNIINSLKYTCLFYTCFLSVSAADMDITKQDKNKVAVLGSIKFCFQPLLEKRDIDENAAQLGFKALPEAVAKPFKGGNRYQKVYLLYPDEIVLSTSQTEHVCAVNIRTLDATIFDEQIRYWYEKTFKLEQIKNPPGEPEGSTTITYQTPKKNNIKVMVSYSEKERPNQLQGLITIKIGDLR